MDDSSRDRKINTIIRNGIDWSSQQVKLICPPREAWSWKRILNWMGNDPESKKEETEKRKKYKDEHPSPPRREEIIEKPIEPKNINECVGSYCKIKMQDPCAGCCCGIECIEQLPCTDGTPKYRPLICKCDRKHIKLEDKCCDACGINLESA